MPSVELVELAQRAGLRPVVTCEQCHLPIGVGEPAFHRQGRPVLHRRHFQTGDCRHRAGRRVLVGKVLLWICNHCGRAEVIHDV